jgi:hypothetical protein
MSKAKDLMRQLREADFDHNDMSRLNKRMGQQRPVRGINPGCEGQRCRFANGEIRVLPGVYGGGNSLLCHECFLKEMKYRQEHNDDPEEHYGVPAEAGEVMRGLTGSLGLWPIPRWEDLDVYDAG